MPAEYNPFADLEAYGADLKARRGAAAATSAQADQAALKFGLQNLEGNQAMSKQQLVNKGNLANTGLENEGKERVGYIAQQVDPNLPPAMRAQMLARALQSGNYKNIGAGYHDFRAAGRGVDDAIDMKPGDFPMQEMIAMEPIATGANRVLGEVTNQNTNEATINDAIGPDGKPIGFAATRSRKAGEQHTEKARGPGVQTPSIPHYPNGSKSQPPQAAPSAGAAPQPAANPAQGALDKLKASGSARPDAQLTGVIDQRGRHQVKDGSGKIGWLSQ